MLMVIVSLLLNYFFLELIITENNILTLFVNAPKVYSSIRFNNN